MIKLVNFRRFYRFDTTSTEVFKELKDKYYGIVVSAHILSYTPTSVVQLINTVNKPFFIDPFTHVFARDMDIICKVKNKTKLKKSFEKLIDDYGVLFSDCKKMQKFTVSKFKKNTSFNDDFIDRYCKSVLDFQHNKCKVNPSFPKYEKLLKKEALPTSVKPSFLVAPYFYIDKYSSDWYEITLHLARRAKKLKGDFELYIAICISSDMLYDLPNIDKMIHDFDGFDGYLIWIDNLDEERIITDELDGLKRLIRGLGNYEKPVYSLYGGFLMDLLAKFALGGYSSGICYGEKRSVDSKGGGADIRHYVPATHVKISADIANQFFAESKRNLELLCACSVCTEVRAKIPSNLSAKDYADKLFADMQFLDHRRHFVAVKYDEMVFVEDNDKNSLKDLLQNQIELIDNTDPVPSTGNEPPPHKLSSKHLKIWRKLFLD